MPVTPHLLRNMFQRTWESGLALILILIISVGLALGLYTLAVDDIDRQPGTVLLATITELRVGASKYRPGLKAIVVAQDQQGVIGRTAVQASLVAGCHVGSKVRAKRSGVTLTLEPAPCPASAN